MLAYIAAAWSSHVQVALSPWVSFHNLIQAVVPPPKLASQLQEGSRQPQQTAITSRQAGVLGMLHSTPLAVGMMNRGRALPGGVQ